MEKGRWRPLLTASLNLRLRAYSSRKGTGAGRLFSVRRTAMQVLVVAFVLSTARSAGVDVDEVVLHAEIAEHAHPAATGDRVSVRFSPHGIGHGAGFSVVSEVGPVGVNGSGGSSRSGGAVGSGGSGAIASRGVSQALARALASAGFDWQQPLSVQPFVAFRALHPPGGAGGSPIGRTERVVRLSREGLIVATATAFATASAFATATDSAAATTAGGNVSGGRAFGGSGYGGRSFGGETRQGELREIELAVDAETYRVVREAFVFASIGRFEIEELGHRVARHGPARYDAASYDSTRYESARKPVVAAIPAHASRDELDLADLKRRLLLAKSGADVRAADRRGGVPGSRMPEVATFGLRRWRYRTFGESATRQTFLPDLTRSLGDVRQRLEILTDLGEHYPAPRNHMSAATRTAFQDLVDLQYRRLRAELNDVKQRVATLSGSINVAVDTASAPAYLVSRAAEMLSCARALEQLVRESLGQDDLTVEDRQRINGAFGALWEAVYGPAPSRP